MRLSALLVVGLLTACASAPWVPDDAPHADELRSFEKATLRSQEGDGFRLLLHEWHLQPALLEAACNRDTCWLEIRLTNGYGTYFQGELEAVNSAPLPRERFHALAEQLGSRGIWNLPDHNDELRTGVDENGEEVIYICMHSPSYFVEARIGNDYIVVQRYCEDNYEDGYTVAAPLLALFQEEFPAEFAAASHVTEQDLEEYLAN